MRVTVLVFSAIVVTALSRVTAVGTSFTSVTSIVKLWVLSDVSELVALTEMVWDVAASKFSKEPSATVTTPVVELISKRPSALSVRL